MSEALPTNLPLQLTSFIGREREIAEVERLLGTTRLFTLTGSGGCGQTRLALEFAANLHNQFPEGVWLVDLPALSNAPIVPQSVATILKLRESGETSLSDILKNYLRAKTLLLVLDSCERLIQTRGQLCNALLQDALNLIFLPLAERRIML